MRESMLKKLLGVVVMIGLFVPATPAVANGEGEREFHAYLLQGTCETVASRPVADLGALEPGDDVGGEMATIAGVDAGTAWGVETHVAPALDDLRARPHVVAVRETRHDRLPVVACGQVEGDGDAVEIALKPFGATGVEGLARVETVKRVEATTVVTVGLWEQAPETAARSRQMPEAPDLAITLLDGDTVHLADYRGKTVVLVMWASWCPYCNKEFPMYEEMWREMQDDDVVFIGVGLKNDDQEDAEAFVEKHGVTFPVGRDTEGGDRVRGEIEATLGVPGTPALFIITPDGYVYGATYGVIERGSFEDAIRDAATYRN